MTAVSNMGMSLDRESLENLLDYLAEQGCDNTHRHSVRWLQLHGFDVDEALELLAKYGGCCCDCEVLLNVDPEVLDLYDCAGRSDTRLGEFGSDGYSRGRPPGAAA